MATSFQMSPQLEQIHGETRDNFRAIANGFQKLDKIKDLNRQSKQLEELTEKMRECKRLIKEFDREIKDEEGRNPPEVNKQLNDEKQSMVSNETLFRGFVTKEGLYAFRGFLPSSKSTCSSFMFTHGSAVPGLPHLNSSNCNKYSSRCSISSKVPSSFSLWHSRLGHPHEAIVKTVLTQCNIPHINKTIHDFCSSCCLGKAHRLYAPSSNTVYTTPFALVYVDLWGPSPVYSSTGFRYYLSIVDAFSKHTWIFLLKLKSETLSVFQYFLQYVKTQFDHSVQSVQSDFGGEFRPFSVYLKTLGIVHRISRPHTHHQQGTIERKHRHIVETGLTLLSHAHLPNLYWDHAFLTADFLINRLPSVSLNHKSPHQILFGKSPDYTLLKVFGCACYPLLRPYNSHKLSPRSSKCIFLGYSPNHKGYKCMTKEGKIYVSRDVVFNEHHFPSATLSSSTSPVVESVFQNVNYSQPHVHVSPPTPSLFVPLTSSPTLPNNSPSSNSSPFNLVSPNSESVPPMSQPVNTQPSLHPMQTRSKSGIYKTIYPRVHLALCEPTSVKAALSEPEWQQAMMIKELNSYVALRKTYMNTLGNKKVELFDMGAGASEPTAQENVQLASELSNQELINAGTKTMDETDQAIERSKQVVHQTIEVGTQTATTLKGQTEQMGRIVNELDSIQFSIKKASQLVKEIGRQVATDKCIMLFLLLIVCGVIAIIVVKIVNPKNKDIRDIPGLAPPAPSRRLLYVRTGQHFD